MNTNLLVSHRPILDVDWIAEHYTKKDGVPVKYVCTTAIDNSAVASDIFYRDTPHPEFGNRYFGIVVLESGPYIYNADIVEDLTFTMLDTPSGYHYSQHRHDFLTVGDVSIDGGRAYTRLLGFRVKTVTFKVKDGEFVLCEQ